MMGMRSDFPVQLGLVSLSRAGCRAWPVLAALVLELAVGALASPISAEPVIDRGLAGAQAVGTRTCAVIKIEFNFRIQYASHFPLNRGADLRIAVRPIDAPQGLALLRREAVRAPSPDITSIVAIELETNVPAGPVLHVRFSHAVEYSVAQGGDFESIIIAVAPAADKGHANARKACTPVYPASGWSTSVARSESHGPAMSSLPGQPAGRGAKTADAGTLRSLEGQMDEARGVLRKGQPDAAITKLRAILRYAENKVSPDAHEHLGLAYEKSGALAQARIEYEDFLRRYSSGEAHDRVAQRLAGIKAKLGVQDGKVFSSGGTAERWKHEPAGETWTVSGSTSQFYIRDDSFRVARDPSLPPDLTKTPDDHRVHQNEILSSFDLLAAWSNESFKTRFRFTGSEEHSFAAGADEIWSVASLYAETTYKPWDLMTRIGRQTRYTSGVLGRFDGGLVSWQSTPWARINVVAGSPVARRADGIFKDEKLFYGASVDFRTPVKGLEASFFAIEQRDKEFLDRQAVGTELRYIDPIKTAFLTLDYDVHFNGLNAAIASGSYKLADKSVITAGADYRKSPYLSAWTALQGQPFLTLYDLLKIQTKAQVDQLAIDRTPTYKSANVGYSRPLSEHLQLNLDATITNVTGTVTSGGVDGLPSTGNEFYYSAQLIGSNMLAHGDLYIGGVRVADREDSTLYVLDLSTRYPLIQDVLSVSPRLRLGYRLGKTSDLTEYEALPSLQLNYYWTRNLSLELEAGVRWTETHQGTLTQTETELLVTAGFRYDFYADDKSKCKPVSVNCR
jgi:hypothetical protein